MASRNAARKTRAIFDTISDGITITDLRGNIKVNLGVEDTGIGLSIVKRIIDVHGGRIWVRSKP